MGSRMVSSIATSSKQVEESAFAFAKKVARGLRPLLEAGLRPGETLPDVALFVELLGRALERDRLRLGAADEGQQKNRLVLAALRQQRERCKADLRACLLEVRQGARSVYGKLDAYVVVAIEGRISREPTRLLRQAVDVLTSLDRAAPNPPPRRSRVNDFHPAVAARELRPVVDAFRKTLEALAAAGRKGILELHRKRKEYSSHHADLAHVTRLLESLLATARQPIIAARVRPRAHRAPRRVAQEGTSEGSPGPDGTQARDESGQDGSNGPRE